MADKWLVASGVTSNPANWDGGTLPGVSDDCYADGFVGTIDADLTVLTIQTTQRAGGTIGGNFIPTDGVVITGDLYPGESAGASVLKVTSSCSFTLFGRVTSTVLNTSADCIDVLANSTISITGRVDGPDTTGTNGSHAIDLNATTSDLTIIGDVRSGKINGSSGNHSGVYSTGSSLITVVGDVYCLSTGGGRASGVHTTGSASIMVTGNIYGTSIGNYQSIAGVYASGFSSTVQVIGELIPGSNSPAVVALGKLILPGIVQSNASGSPAFQTGSRSTVLITSGSLVSHTYRTDDGGSIGVERSLYTGGTNLGQPVEADVRYATTFGASTEYTGSLRVPDPAYVNAGVLTDATVGTMSASLDATALRTALGMASANLDTQIATLATPTNITAATGIVLAGVTHTGAIIPRVTLVDTTTTNTDMRGTNGANTTAPATPANVSAVTTTLAALLPVALVGGRIDASVGAVATDAINAAAIAADAVTEIQVGLATTLELAKVPKVGGTHVYTQVSADSDAKTANVSISDVV